MLFLGIVVASILGLSAIKQEPKTLVIGVIKRVPKAECIRRVETRDRVSLHYTDYLFDGNILDTTVNRQPFEFNVGVGDDVPKGMDMGVIDMCIGEKRKLVIPPHLAWGEQGRGKVPPNSTLVFEIELVNILNPPRVEL